MEEITLNVADLSTITCSNKKPGRMLCISPDCGKCAVSCGEVSCSCFQGDHPDCDFTNMKKLYQRVQTKRKQVQGPLQQAFNAIDKMFSDAIDILSLEKDKYVLLKENYGLTVEEAEFLEYIAHNNKEKLTGGFLCKAKSASKEPVRESLLTQDKVQAFWNKELTKLNDMIRRISSMVAYSSDAVFRYAYFEWDQQKLPPGVIKEDRTIQTTANMGAYNAVTTVSSLPRDKVLTWALKINYCVSSVGVGVCNSEAKNRYNSQLHEFGVNAVQYEGVSILYANGQDTNHLKNVVSGFGTGLIGQSRLPFRTGDTMYIRVNFQKQMVLFNKNLQSICHLMNLTNLTEDDEIYPCAMLISSGDSVTINEVDKETDQKLTKLYENHKPIVKNVLPNQGIDYTAATRFNFG